MNNNTRFIHVRNELNAKSPSLCLAKWLQVTINLQNGTGHSCHHPIVHKIPLSEIEQSPSALHNTNYKKQQRQKMKQGERPLECNYCWRIEDASPDNFSDRTFKSSEDWAQGKLEEIWTSDSQADIQPTYVEVSFGHECNLKCAYCSPLVSSAIQAEYIQHGSYPSVPYFDLEKLKSEGLLPFPKDEHNPYVEAFWNWWPELTKELKVFRITGGEPLLNRNTFRFIENLLANPMPGLDLAINTNLSVPEKTLNRFLELSSTLVKKKCVKKYEIYTSIDTYGPQAEYIRAGLQSNEFWQNAEKTLNRLPEINLVVMCTFNFLSLFSFEKLLEHLAQLKLRYRSPDGSLPRIQLSTSYLRFPLFMAADLALPEHLVYLEKALDFMLRNSRVDNQIIFTEFEIHQVRRILEMLRYQKLPEDQRQQRQTAFYQYFKEYDRRKGLNFSNVFPELKTFFEEGKVLLFQKL